MTLPDDMHRIIHDFLRDSVAAHKRRVAIRQGSREPVTEGCDHSDWDIARHWCNSCGITKEELLWTTR